MTKRRAAGLFALAWLLTAGDAGAFECPATWTCQVWPAPQTLNSRGWAQSRIINRKGGMVYHQHHASASGAAQAALVFVMGAESDLQAAEAPRLNGGLRKQFAFLLAMRPAAARALCASTGGRGTGVCDEHPWLAPGGVCRFTSAVLNYPRKLAKCIRREAPAKSLQGPYGLVAEPRGGKA